MARTITQIRQNLIASLVSFAQSVGLNIFPNNWSKTDYKLLTLETVAEQQGIQEQLYDSFEEDMLAIAARACGTTAPWIQYQMLNLFEYDAIAVPIVQLDVTGINGSLPTFAPYYPNPNPNFRIIKYCSVVPGTFGKTTIKIAGVGPSKILSTPVSAAQSFVNTILISGITYDVISLDADRLFMQLNVYYNGLYSATIENDVKNAITAFLNSLSTINFDGKFLTTLLEQAIMKVAGIYDVVFDNLQARANITTVGTGTNLILDKTEIQRDWDTVAGYIVLEDTTGANWMLSDYRIGASGIKNLNLIPR